MRRKYLIVLLFAVFLALSVCGSAQADVLTSEFHADRASGNGRAQIDVSSTSQGYIAVSASSDKRLKFQVIKGDITYTYDLPNNGTPAVFPLQSGSGSYHARIMENVVDNKYAELYGTNFSASLSDEFQPFLRPNLYVNYHPGSACVQTAGSIAGGVGTSPEKVAAVYSYVCAHVTYDREKAASVQSGYVPNPDQVLASGKGICFDYASLAASMLRSQGVPTKMIFGYVSPNGLYHAWNMFYTPETGWVTVSFQANPGWNRLDLTFSANGADDSFIGNGGNYSDLYFY